MSYLTHHVITFVNKHRRTRGLGSEALCVLVACTQKPRKGIASMAREKGQKSRRTKKSRSSGAARKNADKHASVWASRLRAVTILLAVGAVAIFLGYTVGN